MRFGDGGHGYVMPASPWKGYGHRDVRIESSAGWVTDRAYRKGTRQDGLYGLAGFSCSSSSSDDWALVRTNKTGPFGRSVSSIEITYLKQPDGGRFQVFVDGEPYRRVRTRARKTDLGVATVRVPDGAHEVRLNVVGDGEVRLFGMVLERTRKPGVVVDSLGINGARATVLMQWDEALWTAQLKRRKPDLVILAYGTNEAGDTHVSVGRYEERLAAVLTRLKKAAPRASCVLVGPTDRPIKRGGTWVHRERTDVVVDVQRRMSAQFGCGFWNAEAEMGGPLSIVRWADMDPPLARRDYVHLTSRGYELLGDAFSKALLQNFRAR